MEAVCFCKYVPWLLLGGLILCLLVIAGAVLHAYAVKAWSRKLAKQGFLEATKEECPNLCPHRRFSLRSDASSYWCDYYACALEVLPARSYRPMKCRACSLGVMHFQGCETPEEK